MAGNDLVGMSDQVREVLCHKGIIAVNQDWGGSQGKLIRIDGQMQVWEKPMSDGATALAYLNRGDTSVQVRVTDYSDKVSTIKDVWSGDFAAAGDSIEVEPHGAILLLAN